TALRVDKDDPYRRRFGELVGLSAAHWPGVDPGFFAYAVRDAVATRRLYPALAAAAYGLMVSFGFDRSAERYDIRPDALDRFGYLSEFIQVKASVVLAHLFRRGVRVNLDKARALEDKYRAEIAAIVAKWEQTYRGILVYARDGCLKLTPKSRTPSLAKKGLVELLQHVAAEVRGQGQDLQVPISDGKKKEVSLSVKAWGQYATL